MINVRPPRRLGWILLVLLAAANVGCAGANARQLSRETLAQTTEYENAVRATSRALATYYQSGVGELENRITIARQTELDARVQRAADDAIDRARSRGLVSQDFRAFVEEVISADLVEVARSVAALDQIRQHRKTLLDQIDAQEKRLKTIRTKLEVLQTEPGWKDRLSDLKPYFDAASKLLEDSKPRQGAAQ